MSETSSAPRKAPPSRYKSPAQEATIAIVRAADAIARRFNAVVEPHGITTQQYNVLRILRGVHPGRLPTLEIGERLIERTPGITRLLDRLEEKGLVRRERCTDDRRLVHCWITDAGLELLAGLDGEMDRADEEPMRLLTTAETRSLAELLARVLRAAE